AHRRRQTEPRAAHRVCARLARRACARRRRRRLRQRGARGARVRRAGLRDAARTPRQRPGRDRRACAARHRQSRPRGELPGHATGLTPPPLSLYCCLLPLPRLREREKTPQEALMPKHIVIIPGDDAAPEAMAPTVEILKDLGLDLSFTEFPPGAEGVERYGSRKAFDEALRE